MNQLNREQRAKKIAALVEGNSLRATARMCDVAFNTVLKLLPSVAESELALLIGRHVFLLRIAERPNLITLNALARQVAEHLVLILRARLTNG